MSYRFTVGGVYQFRLGHSTLISLADAAQKSAKPTSINCQGK